MVNCTERQIRSSDRSPGLTQTFEGLRRRHFVNEMEIYVEECWFALGFTNNVGFPEFVERVDMEFELY